MTTWQAVLLGTIQGLTEFLPVSSRGHLALAQALMPGFSQPGLVFDVSLHLGTVVAIMALEWQKIVEAVRERYLLRLGAHLVLAMAATSALALPLRRWAEESIRYPLLIAAGFVVTAVLLIAVRSAGGRIEGPSMTWGASAFVGLAQGVVVLLPGMSRSGTTIVAGLGAGLSRRWAADFSFLLSVPAILGAATWGRSWPAHSPPRSWDSPLWCLRGGWSSRDACTSLPTICCLWPRSPWPCG